jgi:stage II sporulation protein D
MERRIKVFRNIHKAKLKLLLIILVIVFFLISLFFIGKSDKIVSDPDIKTKITTISNIIVYNHETEKVIEMPMDDYLICVVAAEMPASFMPEALKAQAVSARTYTIYKSQHSGCSDSKEKADVCTNSAHCQAYVSFNEMKENWGEDYGHKFLKVKSAVDMTIGEIIIYAGDPIEVFYHASAGGKTEDSGNVFTAQRPYLISVSSYGEEVSSNYYSKENFSIDEFVSILENKTESFSIDQDKLKSQIKKPIRFDTGRVKTISIGNTVFDGKEIRKAFGLNSTNFEIEVSENMIIFSCVGFGHGVGMSQTGANAMAMNGEDYKEILKHYFVGVEIVSDY